jgi:kynurenine formamidase
MEHKPGAHVSQLLEGLPTNWGRWGKDDELGGLNFLTAQEIERGLGAVKAHKTFTLSLVINGPKGDPVWPGRAAAVKLMFHDKGQYISGKSQPLPGGLEFADDHLSMFTQGSTQFDALGHVWHGDKIYNGYDAKTTIGGLDKASVLPLAERTASGHAVLLDVARWRNKPRLGRGELITLKDVLDCAAYQKVKIQKHDILLIRTGWLQMFYDEGPAKFYEPPFIEPGLTFSRELIQWFHETEIPLLGTDTVANEVTVDPNTGIALPLHCALMVNLGVVFNEMLSLEALADDCAKDGRYNFFYTAAPLKIHRGTGAPVNPIVIK